MITRLLTVTAHRVASLLLAWMTLVVVATVASASSGETGQSLRGEPATMGGFNAAALTTVGNAHAREGAVGPAVLAYERALALDPGRSDARANLRLVRTRHGVEVTEPGHLLAFASRAPLRTWMMAGSCGAALALGLMMISFVAPSGRLAVRFLAIVSAGVAVAAAAGLAGYHLDRDAAVILQDDTPLRTSPAASLPAEGHLQAGERVKAGKVHGGFVSIQRADTVAWVPVEAVGRIWMP